MNNKYDVGNFSKILEEYQNEGELAAIDKHLFPERQISEDNTLPTSKLLQHKFEYVPYESKKYNISQIQNDQLTPPRERLSHYQTTGDLLKFINNRIFTETPLHEEYYLSLTKIFQSKEGRSQFLDLISKRFTTNSKLLIGKHSF